MDDLTTYALLATSFFFVAISFGLLVRYRQVSQRVSSSTDMGRDLWSSLEQRLRKQDERILDMMGRLEVVQSRVLAPPVIQTPAPPAPLPPPPTPAAPLQEKPSDVTKPEPTTQQPELLASQPESQESQAKPQLELDKTQQMALGLLSSGPVATPDILKGLTGRGGPKSREHVARLMKELFELGLVRRNDTSKPFVYQLTDEGRRLLNSRRPD